MLVLDDLQGKVETANFLRTFLNFKLSFDFLMKTFLHIHEKLRFFEDNGHLKLGACKNNA